VSGKRKNGAPELCIAGNFSSRVPNFGGGKFWARGYLVSTIGRDENLIWEYIRPQELKDVKEDGLIQPDLFQENRKPLTASNPL